MIHLKRSTLDKIRAQAVQTPDVEVCGLVTAGIGGEQVFPLGNVASDPSRYYETSTSDLAAAFRSMDILGNVPVAYYHSHPGGSPTPSEADMEGALNVGMHYLIAYPDKEDRGIWKMHAWECIEQGVLVNDLIEVVP